jgi:hypothetical protein
MQWISPNTGHNHNTHLYTAQFTQHRWSKALRSVWSQIFIRFLAQKCKSALKQVVFSPMFHHRTFSKNQPHSPPCPWVAYPPWVPCRPDSSLICASNALPGLSSLAQAPALAPRFTTPVRRPVRDSRADPLSAAQARHPQRPWSIVRQVLLHHSPRRPVSPSSSSTPESHRRGPKSSSLDPNAIVGHHAPWMRRQVTAPLRRLLAEARRHRSPRSLDSCSPRPDSSAAEAKLQSVGKRVSISNPFRISNPF